MLLKEEKDFSVRHAQLSMAKRALLERRLRGELASSSEAVTISRQPRQGSVPLSLAQQCLWYLDQLEPRSSAYNIPDSLRLNFPVDTQVLKQSLQALVQRHEVLRTTFVAVDGQPMQVIAPTLSVPLPAINLSNLPEMARWAEAQRLANEEAQRPFDLAQGPLLRLLLLQLGAEEYVLLLTMHHIISDGWSIGLFFQELAALYTAFVIEQPSPLPDLPIQYVDYALWQREVLQGDRLAGHLSYWKQQLAGSPAGLELPTDRPRLPVPASRGSTYCVTLPKVLTTALKELSRQEGVTLYMTLVAAFQTLLYRYSGQDDVVIGTVSAGRTQAEAEALIGFFVNTLVLRTDLSGNPTFRELLERVREVIFGSDAHQEVPFESLVRELHPTRALGQNPLFQVMLVLQPPPPTLPSRWERSQMVVETGTAKFDLSLEIADRPEGLVCYFEYSTDLFDAATIARISGHWQTLLEGIVADPTRRLAELPLLTEKERQQLLVDWNATQAAYPKDKCIHQLFEAQVERTPEAIAVVFGDERLTYRELNRKANQLAHHLQRLGVGPDVLVGLYVERSLEMVVGLLGILKAGGAYVPLDPTYPAERIAFMMTDARPHVLLTQQRLLADLPEHEAHIICLDTDWSTIAQQSEANPTSEVSSENLAYVIYTSGSTGQPKGVMIAHRAICNHMFWMQARFPLAATDRVLQKTPFSFDASMTEFYAPLLSGAQLIMARPGGQKDSEYLIETMAEQKVTILQLVPSLLRVLLEDREIERCRSLRRVFCAGEELPIDLQSLFFNRLDANLINLYGPTEASIDATFWPCQRESVRPRVPIGRPIANTQIYLLDAQLQPVPIGVSGDLYIGGYGLARGYLNRPELTAERFIRHPFSGEPAARLYKTGDLARYLPDGTVEFLGRTDQQVKIRGFRIEPGEIETVLELHLAVREAVVVAREHASGDKHLVAYVVAHQRPAPASSELRSFLQKQLPDYMVPSAFVFLEALPLTPNGKVDRSVLPIPDVGRTELEGTFVAPRTDIEDVLADIWTQVLRLEKVSIHDNFFELGGDSILGMQIISRARRAGLNLIPRYLIQYPTIAELAAVVIPSPSLEAEQGAVRGAVPVTPIQSWFFERQFQAPHHWNQAWLLEANRVLDTTWLKQAVQQVVVHHDALRLRFKLETSGWQQFYAEHETAEIFRQIDLSNLSLAEQQATLEKVAAETQASLNLETGPLLRVVYFSMGQNQSARLLLVIHHLVVDGVSWRILMEDLVAAYQLLQQGKAPHLPPKTISYQKWAQRLMAYAQSTTLRQELSYWLNVPSEHISALPVDHTLEPGANTMASARVVNATLSVEETQAVLQKVPQAYHTQINDVLLTALVQAFAQWTGAHSLLLDLEGHGREPIDEEVDLSRSVGWFTTMFPVCLTLNDASPEEALRGVKEQLRQIPNRGIGYGILRYLGNQEDAERLRALPQAQVSFNYLGQFDQMASKELLFRLAHENAGPTCSPQETQLYLLEVNGLVIDGQLQISLLYNERVYQRSTIEQLAQRYLEALSTLVAQSQSPKLEGSTPYDSLPVKLNVQEFHNLQEDVYLQSPVLPMVVQAGGSKRPFFFLHGDFLKGAFYCFPLARNLGPDQPFYALEPYRFDVLGVPPTIEAISAAYLESLRSIQPEGPYLLGGFCNGGLLAYEMARQLHAQGETVDLLISIDPPLVDYRRLTRHICNRIGKLIRLDQDKQLYCFLWLRHMYRYLQHMYRYLRFPSYRKRKTDLDGERADQDGMVLLMLKNEHELWLNQGTERLGSDEQRRPGPKGNRTGFTLPRLNDLFPEALFPPVEALRHDWTGIFAWVMAEYEPGFYPGKSTFFFTKDSQAYGEDEEWRKIAEAKDKEVEVHHLAGRHDTCKTIHLHDLAEHLLICLNKAQVAKTS